MVVLCAYVFTHTMYVHRFWCRGGQCCVNRAAVATVVVPPVSDVVVVLFILWRVWVVIVDALITVRDLEWHFTCSS